jgi:hypothetical protein
MALRPAASGYELDPQKVSDLSKYTIFHNAGQFAIGVTHAQSSTLRDGPVYLQAGARERYVLQISHTTPGTTALVLPLHVH